MLRLVGFYIVIAYDSDPTYANVDSEDSLGKGRALAAVYVATAMAANIFSFISP